MLSWRVCFLDTGTAELSFQEGVGVGQVERGQHGQRQRGKKEVLVCEKPTPVPVAGIRLQVEG